MRNLVLHFYVLLGISLWGSGFPHYHYLCPLMNILFLTSSITLPILPFSYLYNTASSQVTSTLFFSPLFDYQILFMSSPLDTCLQSYTLKYTFFLASLHFKFNSILNFKFRTSSYTLLPYKLPSICSSLINLIVPSMIFFFSVISFFN